MPRATVEFCGGEVMRGRLRLIIAGAAALFVVIYLVGTGLGSGTVYYYTVDEIDLSVDSGKVIRLAGTVMPGSLRWRSDGPELTFMMGPLPIESAAHGGVRDEREVAAAGGEGAVDLLGKPVSAAPLDSAGDQKVPVRYTRLKPDLLAEDVEVVAEGTLVGGVFEATQLLVKCPSKYEAQVD